MTSKLIVDSSHCNELMINTDEISLSSVTDTTSLLVACPELPPSAAPRMFSLSILSLFTRFRELFALVVATVVWHSGTVSLEQSLRVSSSESCCVSLREREADEATSFLLQGFEQWGHWCSTTEIWYSHCFYILQPNSRNHRVVSHVPAAVSFDHWPVTSSAMSYDWSKGHSGVPPAGQSVNKVMLHPVKPEEVNKKPKRN